ncbi:MAG: DHA2 family efflux MFS transporter permease subunit [Aliidongia sp.]
MAGSFSPGRHNPWLVALVVSIATFMEVLDTTIANVALRYISGGLGVGPDEAAWVVTTYLVANAIVLCASGWIATAIGRKAFFLICVAAFTVSSILCGFAWSLQSLLVFRVLQGFAGGGMTPVAQSILASSFPPEKRGQAFALYGVAVVVAPVIGPTLGGWLADNWSWHWCFLINGPVGVMSLISVYFLVDDPPEARKARAAQWRKGFDFDLVGFLLVAGFLGALEVCLDEGQRKDWFGSNLIVMFATISATSLILFIPWEMTRKTPLIDLRMLTGRHFGSCFLVMLATGAILIATTQIVPQMLQDNFGYTATWAGLALSPGGIVTAVMMVVVGRLSGFVPAKWLIVAGALIITAGMYNSTNLNANLNFGWFVWQRVYIGIGLPLIFISITNASYDGIAEDKTDQASAMINVARNTGGSIGVSIAQNVLMYREQFHQSRLIEHIVPSTPAYQQSLAQSTRFFESRGIGAVEAAQQAFAQINQTVQQQVALWGYIDVFVALGLVSFSAVPLALLMRPTKSAGKTEAA